jgi:hypothetical protein
MQTALISSAQQSVFEVADRARDEDKSMHCCNTEGRAKSTKAWCLRTTL